MADSIDPASGTDWRALILSTLIPITIAAGFIYLAQLPDWQPSESWMLGIAFLFPLRWILGQTKSEDSKPSRAQHYERTEPVKSVLGFEDEVIRSLKEKSSTNVSRNETHPRA